MPRPTAFRGWQAVCLLCRERCCSADEGRPAASREGRGGREGREVTRPERREKKHHCTPAFLPRCRFCCRCFWLDPARIKSIHSHTCAIRRRQARCGQASVIVEKPTPTQANPSPRITPSYHIRVSHLITSRHIITPPPRARPCCCLPCPRVLCCYFPATPSSRCWSKAGKRW